MTAVGFRYTFGPLHQPVHGARYDGAYRRGYLKPWQMVPTADGPFLYCGICWRFTDFRSPCTHLHVEADALRACADAVPACAT